MDAMDEVDEVDGVGRTRDSACGARDGFVVRCVG